MAPEILIQRVTYGILTITVLVGLFLLDVQVSLLAEAFGGPWGALLRRGSVVPVVATILFVLAAREWTGMLRSKNTRPHARVAGLLVAALLLTPWLASAGWLGLGPAEMEAFVWTIAVMAMGAIWTALIGVWNRQTEGVMRDLSATWLVVLFMGFMGSFAVYIRCGVDTPEPAGAWLLLFVVLVAKASDIGGFLVGSAIGRHKLIPALSPAKSVEGMVGGIAASVLVAWLMMWWGGRVAPLSPMMASAGEIAQPFGVGIGAALALLSGDSSSETLVRAAIWGILLAAASQAGDIFESGLKRDAVLKDSGRFLPRFGGVFDLLDSLVFALPVGWFLLTMVWQVV